MHPAIVEVEDIEMGQGEVVSGSNAVMLPSSDHYLCCNHMIKLNTEESVFYCLNKFISFIIIRYQFHYELTKGFKNIFI